MAISRSGTLRSQLRLLLVAVPAIYFISCATFQAVDGPPPPWSNAVSVYERNLLHWNTLSMTEVGLDPLPPVFFDHNEYNADHLTEINFLFDLAFRLMAVG